MNAIENKLFEAQTKLDLMQTLLNVTIDELEESVVALSETSAAAYLSNQRSKVIDLLHIAFNGIDDVKEILERLNDMKEIAA